MTDFTNCESFGYNYVMHLHDCFSTTEMLFPENRFTLVGYGQWYISLYFIQHLDFFIQVKEKDTKYTFQCD